jgi:hypothetical protein
MVRDKTVAVGRQRERPRQQTKMKNQWDNAYLILGMDFAFELLRIPH